jgi:hypothetical protein
MGQRLFAIHMFACVQRRFADGPECVNDSETTF